MKVFRSIFLLVSVWTYCPLFAQQATQQQEAWKLAKDKDGIQIFTRRLESSGFKEIKGVVEVNTSIRACIDLLKNERAATDWVDRIILYKNLEMPNDTLWFTYGEIAIPWPFNNKDFVAANTLVLHPDGQKATIRISSLPDRLPEEDGKKRIKLSEGQWIFEKLENGKIRASHQIYAEANDFLPPWLVNWVVVGSVYNTFESFKEQFKN